jgi:hypothetical protein
MLCVQSMWMTDCHLISSETRNLSHDAELSKVTSELSHPVNQVPNSTPSWEANSRSASQTPRLLWNPKFHSRVTITGPYPEPERI